MPQGHRGPQVIGAQGGQSQPLRPRHCAQPKSARSARRRSSKTAERDVETATASTAANAADLLKQAEQGRETAKTRLAEAADAAGDRQIPGAGQERGRSGRRGRGQERGGGQGPGARRRRPRRNAKGLPVSVFISRKTQRLYIRQGYLPVFEGPVTIRDADKPIGTYVFTALIQHRQPRCAGAWCRCTAEGRRQASCAKRRARAARARRGASRRLRRSEGAKARPRPHRHPARSLEAHLGRGAAGLLPASSPTRASASRPARTPTSWSS